LIALGLSLLLLVVIGRLAGGLADVWLPRATELLWHGFVILIAALLLAMPLAGIAPLAAVLSMPVANDLVSWLFIAGLLMLVTLWTWRPFETPMTLVNPRATLIAAAIAFGLIVAMTMPLSVTQHRLALTPERSCMAVLATILLLPFFYAFELIVRRGRGWQPIVFGAIGRIIILVLIGLSVWFGAMPFVLGLLIGVLLLQFIAYEIFANAAYSASGNLAMIALVESAWMAWFLSALFPIMFSF
jgi:hypothetical protein